MTEAMDNWSFEACERCGEKNDDVRLFSFMPDTETRLCFGCRKAARNWIWEQDWFMEMNSLRIKGDARAHVGDDEGASEFQAQGLTLGRDVGRPALHEWIAAGRPA